jgi:radical SAM superfamily enzyme YgiQ (UPF0313 family)
METLDFIKKSKIDKFGVNILTPLPGTPVWKYAVDNNLIAIDSAVFDWRKIDILYSHSHEYNIHLPERLSRDALYAMYLLFEAERKKREIRWAMKLLFTGPSRFVDLFYDKVGLLKTVKKHLFKYFL